MSRPGLFYVGPEESKDHILKYGIQPPLIMKESILSEKVTTKVLNFSYDMYTSKFPNYVSLLLEENSMGFISKKLHSHKMKSSILTDFNTIVYYINDIIMEHKSFVNVDVTQQMCGDSIPDRVLYRGIIKPEHIFAHFSVRSWKH